MLHTDALINALLSFFACPIVGTRGSDVEAKNTIHCVCKHSCHGRGLVEISFPRFPKRDFFAVQIFALSFAISRGTRNCMH